MSPRVGLIRSPPPIDRRYYDALLASRESWTTASTHTVTRGTGYGFEVSAGQAWRFTMLEHAQIIDLCVAAADDATEHFAAGTQMAWEGGWVTRGARIWGTPPASRPLAYVTADTIAVTENARHARDHVCHGAHCNPHHWMLYTGTHPRTCYDNLRAGFAMLGHHQRMIHDNMNLFQNTALDVYDGGQVEGVSNAEAGDYIEFFAEVALHVVISLCPQGSGVDPEPGGTDAVPYVADWPVFPVEVRVLETGAAPLDWPPKPSR